MVPMLDFISNFFVQGTDEDWVLGTKSLRSDYMGNTKHSGKQGEDPILEVFSNVFVFGN